jgi:hypothetical protein
MGPAADARQSRHRPLHSSLSLPVSSAARLGRGGKPIQKTDCLAGNGHQVIEWGRGIGIGQQVIECGRGKRQQIRGRRTRGDLVELIVRQRYRTFSIRWSIRWPTDANNAAAATQLRTLPRIGTLSIIKR